eukprot:6195955-Pleurochrysis_carterae.AAC.3
MLKSSAHWSARALHARISRSYLKGNRASVRCQSLVAGPQPEYLRINCDTYCRFLGRLLTFGALRVQANLQVVLNHSNLNSVVLPNTACEDKVAEFSLKRWSWWLDKPEKSQTTQAKMETILRGRGTQKTE